VLEKLKSMFAKGSAAISSSGPQPPQPACSEAGNAPLTAAEIGYAIGAAGGSVAQAAEFQYVLSRVAPDRRPTADEIGRIVAVMGGSLPQAIIIDKLLNSKKE
jgi:hypothetical protein